MQADRNQQPESLRRGPSFDGPTRLARSAWIVALIAAVLWFALLGSRPLFRPDEGRYAEIPREMVTSGDWLVPHLNGLVYVEKPPLQYWVTASLYRALGTEVWVARLATGLSAALGIVLVGWAARRLWGSEAAVLACAVCASAPLYFLIGQQLTLDMSFTLWLTAALVTFCVAQSVRDDRRSCRRWMMLCWVAIAAAVMTKGVAALAIPAAALAVYSIWQRDTGVWRSSYIVSGLALCLVLVAPWFIAMSRAVPGFAQFFFIHEHLLRYATLSADRYEPWWFFLPVLIAGMAPWLPQLIAAWRSRAMERAPRGNFDARRVLWVWAAVVFLFFSASKSKLIPYVLPIIPVVALLIAGSRASVTARTIRLSVVITLATAAALLTVVLGGPSHAHEGKQLALVVMIVPGLVAMTITLTACGVVTLWLVKRFGRTAAALGTAIGWFAGGVFLVGWAAAAAGPLYSAVEMAKRLETRAPTPTHVYSVAYYEQTLPFYLGRTIDVVEFTGELEFGQRLDPARALSMDEFKSRWRGDGGACAIMEHTTYKRLAADGLPMMVINQDPNYILVGRQ
jgi:4-amino-4-deoxy-L-arabinose transferase-like glycosyltransferase